VLLEEGWIHTGMCAEARRTGAGVMKGSIAEAAVVAWRWSVLLCGSSKMASAMAVFADVQDMGCDATYLVLASLPT
jgi:hypothetical protein